VRSFAAGVVASALGCASSVPEPAEGPKVVAKEPAQPVVETEREGPAATEVAPSFPEIESLPERAWVVRLGAARLEPEGEAVGEATGATEPFEVYVAATTDDRVQVALVSAGTELLLWIETADVQPQIRRVVPLASGPGVAIPSEDGRLEFGPGQLVDVIERRDGATHVRPLRDGEPGQPAHEGWVPDDALAATYARTNFEPTPDVPVGFVRGGTKLLTRPGGTTVATLPATEAGDTHRIGVLDERDDGWLRIEYLPQCAETIRTVGYVPAKRVDRPAVPPGFGISCGWAKLRGRRPAPARLPRGMERRKVDADLALYAPSGARVGRTTPTASLAQLPDGGFAVPTPWGLIPVNAPALRPDE
jgi:hypothetical protein